MIKIRYPRLTKFRRKNQKLKLIIQIVAIWYIAFISIGYLTSSTGAYFIAKDEKSISIQAGIWDESKLSFTKKGNDNQNEFICPVNEFEISTVIKNGGTTEMTSDGLYEVYFIENGQRNENGTKVAEGKIAKLQVGQEIILTQKVTSEGFYIFKTFEDTGQNKEKVIWSEKIKVKCKTSNSPEKAGGELVNPVTPTNNDQSKVEETKTEQTVKEESKTKPGEGTESSDPNSNKQNNTVSENNNGLTVTEEEQKENESQNN
ncbi:amyloid fiber anchoring/assembly protein TapA [Neobacillus sp. K501]